MCVCVIFGWEYLVEVVEVFSCWEGNLGHHKNVGKGCWYVVHFVANQQSLEGT